jgi:hypothetical protein
MSESQDSSAETLMNALITKMESMDGDILGLKEENLRLRKMLNNPQSLMKSMGLVPVSTPLAEDVMGDGFRPTTDDAIMKGPLELGVPTNNAEFHTTSWEDIHEMAVQAKSTGNVDAPFQVEQRRDE